MTVWIDAQLSPSLALWVTNAFGYPCFSAKLLGLRDATDEAIFWKARDAQAIVLTKDEDFVKLLQRHGSPPKIIWLTCGSTANGRVREILTQHLETALRLLQTTDLVEITGYHKRHAFHKAYHRISNPPMTAPSSGPTTGTQA